MKYNKYQQQEILVVGAEPLSVREEKLMQKLARQYGASVRLIIRGDRVIPNVKAYVRRVQEANKSQKQGTVRVVTMGLIVISTTLPRLSVYGTIQDTLNEQPQGNVLVSVQVRSTRKQGRGFSVSDSTFLIPEY